MLHITASSYICFIWVFFNDGLENAKQMEKLKAIGNKLPHLPVPRVTVDTSSVPPSRGSEARVASFGLHFVPSQVNKFRLES